MKNELNNEPKFKIIEYISYNHKKIIFSFWEPKGNIPGYLKLCIKTWKKFLSDYEIIILDYESLKEYLGTKLYSQIIFKDMPIAIQSDAIRVALLNKYGGIWMDTDNISEYYYKSYKSLKFLGNKIINKLLKNVTENKFFSLDNKKINALPERTVYKNNKANYSQRYREFYFRKRNPKIILRKSKSIIYLHNSWTPLKYKKMSEKEFLKQNILLSNLLANTLNIKI